MAKRTICSVWRTGGYYDARWVTKLANSCGLHRFVFLSDVHPDRGTALDPWPGWWYKMELFRPGVWEPDELVLYMDLDTLVVGDLSDLLAYDGDFAMIDDFYTPSRRQSGVMLLRAGSAPVAHVWKVWSADPAAIMQSYRGDGEFIRATVPDAERIEERYPGQVVSFKVDAVHGVPDNARLVCGHGRPRFDSPEAGWAHHWWEALPE